METTTINIGDYVKIHYDPDVNGYMEFSVGDYGQVFDLSGQSPHDPDSPMKYRVKSINGSL